MIGWVLKTATLNERTNNRSSNNTISFNSSSYHVDKKKIGFSVCHVTYSFNFQEHIDAIKWGYYKNWWCAFIFRTYVCLNMMGTPNNNFVKKEKWFFPRLLWFCSTRLSGIRDAGVFYLIAPPAFCSYSHDSWGLTKRLHSDCHGGGRVPTRAHFQKFVLVTSDCM